MLTMSEIERAYLTSTYALTISEDEGECLVGLTVSESNFVLDFRRRTIWNPSRGEAEMRVYLDLVIMHEKARLELASHARLQGKNVLA